MDIQFERFQLSNGLTFIFHLDESTPMIAFNVLYNVGAKDEDPDHTGFAHLFEHLMFGGSVNIPNFDGPLQMAGGENNAYTTNDFTNFYIQLPAENMETAFWLESDRMLSLAFSQESLDVQKKVVMEEFKEHYLSKPYGNIWHIMRELCYTTHPYRWMTIGKNLEHIEKVSLQQVKNFFFKHYCPQNAIICVAGNSTLEEVKRMAKKWFGDIPAGHKYERNLPQEPVQKEARFREVFADVPVSALVKAWHIGDRRSRDYYVADIISEILGNGKSSRFHHRLIKEQQIFSSIECYHTGSIDPGLLVIEGRLAKNITLDQANEAIEKEIELLLKEGIEETELQKAIQKIEVQIVFEDMQLLSRANNLAYYEWLGDANMMNTEFDNYQSVTVEELMSKAQEIFKSTNSNTLFYKTKSKIDTKALHKD